MKAEEFRQILGILNEQFWTSYLQISDKNGNIIECNYFGTDGKPCFMPNIGYSKSTGKCDEKGNMIEGTFFGINDEPCFHREGFANYTVKYDENGNRR